MNEKPLLVDGNALESWLAHLIDNFQVCHDQYHKEQNFDKSARMLTRIQVAKSVYEQVQSGRFNVKEEMK